MPDVVIPVLNEAAALPGLLGAMPAGYRPIVVDNASTDGSGAVAVALGALVVVEPVCALRRNQQRAAGGGQRDVPGRPVQRDSTLDREGPQAD